MSAANDNDNRSHEQEQYLGSVMLTPEQRTQLDILGYAHPESRIRVRCFAAKNMPLEEQLKRGMAWQNDEKSIIPTTIEGWFYPNKGQGVFVRLKKKRAAGGVVEFDANGNAIWIETKTYQNGIAYLSSLNVKGYGIYIIPNEGGGADADITRFPALFYECDGISKDEQWQKLRSLEAKLGRPASKVAETRNSLHCYFALVSGSLLPSTWTQYQQRLIQEQDSDDGIWNPSRLMRLVGFDHQKWNTETGSLEQFPVRLVQENSTTFTLDEFDQILPKWDSSRWQQKSSNTSKRGTTESAERVASDPVDDPWDIRNFAHYLDGYLPDGRRGWGTCKCPAHNGTSNNSLHINQTTGQFKCHGGCSTKDIYYAAVELAKAHGYQFPEKRTGGGFSSLDSWLFNLKKRLAKTISRRSFWGVAGKDELEPNATENQPALEYQPGERLDVWAKNTQENHSYILDNSATGTGKSFDTGMATPELFGVRQLIYLSSEHRNPSTPTLKCWHDLEARHEGLYIDEFGKLRRVSKPDQPYLIPPNCGRYGTISALRSKNIPGADTAEEICSSCKLLELCRAGVNNYNYLFERSEALSQSRLRAHPVSLPDPIDYDYGNVVLMWDEAGEIFKKHLSIEVTEQDLNLTIAQLALKLPQVWDALRPLLNALHEFLTGARKQPNKFGWNDPQIRELLPKLNDIDVAAIADALKPNLGFLNTTAEYGVNLADLPRQVRKDFSESDAATSERVMREVALNWLPDFLNVLLGNVVGGSLRIQYGILTITVPNERLVQIARAAKSNIFLDATAAAEDLARVLGVDPSEILTVRQAVPDTSNLELIQLATMGRLGIGSRRRNEKGEDTYLQKRIDALIDHIKRAEAQGKKVAVIDFKKYTSEGDGKRRWWADSRGLNDFEDVDVLILIGVPCRNLADLEAELTVLFGRAPKEGSERVRYQIEVKGKGTDELRPYFEMEVSADPDFREFCRRRILADIHQAIGRLRAHRRPEQQLKVYFVADYPLDIPVTLRKASDITPEAATKTERVEMAIRGAIQQLKDAGQKITQAAIAAITGYSQQYISRFRVLLQTLLNPTNNICSKNGEPPPDPDEAQWISKEYLPLLADAPPRELLEGILTTFEAYGASVFQSIWDATPAAAQVKILEALMFTLPAGELRSLFASVTTS